MWGLSSRYKAPSYTTDASPRSRWSYQCPDMPAALQTTGREVTRLDPVLSRHHEHVLAGCQWRSAFSPGRVVYATVPAQVSGIAPCSMV